MALNVQVGNIVCPAATGSQTTNLPSGFDPKALILWTSGRTAAGGGGGNARLGFGCATYRNSTVAQRWWSFASADNVGTSVVVPGGGSASVLKLTNGTTAGVGTQATFTSFTLGASSAFTLNWTVVGTQILVNYVAIGGDDVTDALVSTFSITAAALSTTTVDISGVTGGTGWTGQPGLLLFPLSWNGAETPATGDGDAVLGIGTREAAASGRSFRFGSTQAAATQASNQAIYNNSALSGGGGGALDTAFQMTASASWHANGFAVTKTAGSTSFPIPFLALKFSADVTVTPGESAASTTLNGTNTLTSANTPRLAFLVNTRQTTANAIDTTSTDAAFWGIGASDGTNERYAGCWDDDAQGTASVTGTTQSTTKGIETWVPSTDTKDAEADITISGSNFLTTWTDQAPSAFLYEWVTLGENTAAAAEEVPELSMAPYQGAY